MRKFIPKYLIRMLFVLIGMVAGSFIGYVFDFTYILGISGGRESNDIYNNRIYMFCYLLVVGIIYGIILFNINKKIELKFHIWEAVIIAISSTITYILAYPIVYMIAIFFIIFWVSITNQSLF